MNWKCNSSILLVAILFANFLNAQQGDCIEQLCIHTNEENKKGVVDSEGNEIIPHDYAQILTRPPANFAVKKADHFALFDLTGKKLSEFKYQYIEVFSENLASFRLPGKEAKRGYFDAAGKEVFGQFYGWNSNFNDGIAAVGQDGYGFLINKEGKAITFEDYGMLARNEETGYYIATNMFGEVGVIRKDGSQIIPLRYSDVTVLNDSLFKSELEEAVYYQDDKGHRMTIENTECLLAGESLKEIKNSYKRTLGCYDQVRISKADAIAVAKKANHYFDRNPNSPPEIHMGIIEGMCAWGIHSIEFIHVQKEIRTTTANIWIDVRNGAILHKELSTSDNVRNLQKK